MLFNLNFESFLRSPRVRRFGGSVVRARLEAAGKAAEGLDDDALAVLHLPERGG